MFGGREKSNTIRTKDTTGRDKSEGTGERRKTNKILRQDQTMHTKQDLPKQRKKFYRQEGIRGRQSDFETKFGNIDFITKMLNR